MYFHSCRSIRSCALFSLWISPHHGRPRTVENKGSNVRYNKINITFPDMVIVQNIIPRNMIINLGCASVNNHIPRDDIFDYHHIREGNNITFPARVIVENIIPRNVIINRGAAEVDNHISRDDIFDFHPSRKCNIYFIKPNRTLDPLFSEVLLLLNRPIMLRGDPKRNNWTVSYLYALTKLNLSQTLFFCSTWSLTFRLTNYVIKANDVKLNT